MSNKPRIMIVEARFYEDLAEELAQGAIEALEKADVAWERFTVPGAFEIPGAISMAIGDHPRGAATGRYDGFVALGVVIRGETTHYDVVCNETARAVQELACSYMLPLGFGLLTVENRDQAWARASREKLNKGREAANACLRMLELKDHFHKPYVRPVFEMPKG